MDDESMPTELADLTSVELRDLTLGGPVVEIQLAAYQERLCGQVDRPRINLGTGPPGRVD